MNRSLYLALLLWGMIIAMATQAMALPPSGKPSDVYVATANPVFAQFTLTDAITSSHISWRLHASTDIKMIFVERSQDGKRFEMVGGVRVQLANEQFEDIMPRTTKRLFYRLKAVRTNGEVVFSETQQLLYAHSPELIAYPNPVQSMLTLQLPQGLQEANIAVFDNQGMLMQRLHWRRGKGLPADMVLNLSGLSRGFYFIKATQDSRSWHTKVFKR